MAVIKVAQRFYKQFASQEIDMFVTFARKAFTTQHFAV